MSKSILTIAAVAIAMTFSAATAYAQSNTPGVDWRQDKQAERIFNGVRNGHLTPRETGRLILGQARVHRQEYRAERDGVVTIGERLRLHRSQNRQNRRIYRGKHN